VKIFAQHATNFSPCEGIINFPPYYAVLAFHKFAPTALDGSNNARDDDSFLLLVLGFRIGLEETFDDRLEVQVFSQGGGSFSATAYYCGLRRNEV
jgi:hypothetical protein